MKKLLAATIGIIVLALGFVWATQDETFRQQDVRDPRVLASKLAANASDAETRLVAAGATATSTITLTNSSNEGTCSISMRSDAAGDAGDFFKLLWGDGGPLAFQSDSSGKGTLATKLAIDKDGIFTLKNGETIDNTTADDTIAIASDDADLIVALKSVKTSSGDATLVLSGDNDTDLGDMFGFNNDGDGNLNIQSDTSAQGTLVTQLSLGSTGIITMKGSATLDNTANTAELNITETAVKVSGNFSATGTGGFTGLLTASGGVKFPVASVVETTNQALTLAYGLNVCSNATAAGTGTNTITLANPAAGQLSIIVNANNSVNSLAVALTGNFYAPALNLAPGESAILFATDTTHWFGIGQ